MGKYKDNSHAVLAAATKMTRADCRNVAETMVAEMKAPPPATEGGHGTPYKTGHNRRSIAFKEAGFLGRLIGVSFTVFTQSGYGGLLDTGTAARPAYPYFRPSFEVACKKLGIKQP